MGETTALERIEVASFVSASAKVVWTRIGRAEGINHELAPWLRMTMPRALKGRSLDDVPLQLPLGRSWLLLFGLIPFDYDDLMLAEREQGRRFLETSSMLTMDPWEHERVLVPHEGGCKVIDTLRFRPRGLLRRSHTVRKVMRSIVTAIFRHRHRRLVAYFAQTDQSPPEA